MQENQQLFLVVQYADRMPIGLKSIIENVPAAVVQGFYRCEAPGPPVSQLPTFPFWQLYDSIQSKV